MTFPTLPPETSLFVRDTLTLPSRGATPLHSPFLPVCRCSRASFTLNTWNGAPSPPTRLRALRHRAPRRSPHQTRRPAFRSIYDLPRRSPANPPIRATKMASLNAVNQDSDPAIKPSSTAPGNRSGIVQAHTSLMRSSARTNSPTRRATKPVQPTPTPGTINHRLHLRIAPSSFRVELPTAREQTTSVEALPVSHGGVSFQVAWARSRASRECHCYENGLIVGFPKVHRAFGGGLGGTPSKTTVGRVGGIKSVRVFHTLGCPDSIGMDDAEEPRQVGRRGI